MNVKINGMSCGHCVAAVEKALESAGGLRQIKVEIGKATLEADGSDASRIKAAIENAGYEVAEIS